MAYNTLAKEVIYAFVSTITRAALLMVVFREVVFGFTNISHWSNIMGLLLVSSTVAGLAT